MTEQPFSSKAISVAADEEIVKRVVEGDSTSFEILMRRYNPRVYRTVRAILGGEDEVEDAMQQVYLQAFANLAGFENRSRFSTWITSIAVNEAIARLRRRRIGVVAIGAEDDVIEQIPASGPSPESIAMTSEVRAILESEISQLPETYRTVLVLREVEGLSTEETAECLGIQPDAVKQRLHRARASLRDAIFERAGVSLASLVPFEAPRCNRIVAHVMEALPGRS
jgi:RNA polymerase sigma-70 factor (ECF subfamily)